MSIKVITRVLDHSEQRGAARLLLVALADFANDDGVCWPGMAKLSQKINESERYTLLLIRKLLDSGELLRIVGGGRGRSTIYGIGSGLDAAGAKALSKALDRASRLNPVPEYGVSKKPSRSDGMNRRNPESGISDPGITESGITDLYNTDLYAQRSVIFSEPSEGPNTASEREETAQGENANRHDHDPSCVGVGVGAPLAFANDLAERGLNPTTIHEIIDRAYDPPTILQSLDNMLTDGDEAGQDRDKTIGRFVARLRLAPPEKGHPYERHRRPVQSEPAPHRAQRPAHIVPSGGKHGPTGGSDLHDPGWRDRLLAEAESVDDM